MSKIADVVKLKTGYANFVNLKSAYDEAKENADRMTALRTAATPAIGPGCGRRSTPMSPISTASPATNSPTFSTPSPS